MSSALEQALQALLQRFGARVRAQILQHRLDRHGIDVDDVEQEVRIRLWTALSRDPKAQLPASYIQRTVMSVLVDAVRRASARPAEPLPEAEDQAAEALATDVAFDPQRLAVDGQVTACLLECIRRIPERRRRPLELYLQGFTVPEVAELCELTFDAARKLVYRGLDEVKARMREMGWESQQ